MWDYSLPEWDRSKIWKTTRSIAFPCVDKHSPYYIYMRHTTSQDTLLDILCLSSTESSILSSTILSYLHRVSVWKLRTAWTGLWWIMDRATCGISPGDGAVILAVLLTNTKIIRKRIDKLQYAMLNCAAVWQFENKCVFVCAQQTIRRYIRCVRLCLISLLYIISSFQCTFIFRHFLLIALL